MYKNNFKVYSESITFHSDYKICKTVYGIYDINMKECKKGNDSRRSSKIWLRNNSSTVLTCFMFIFSLLIVFPSIMFIVLVFIMFSVFVFGVFIMSVFTCIVIIIYLYVYLLYLWYLYLLCVLYLYLVFVFLVYL